MGPKDWLGETVGGRYKIEELLGQGGMSAVYKATDPNLRRVVAVKMIHAHLSDNPEFVRRFEEEAAAVAQLRHPNIVQVYDYNDQNNVYFMVLEFVPGETLQARLRRLSEAGRRIPLAEAVKYTAQVCDALDYAHERSIVHRDIKPANIMLNVQGDAILTDFGIAKILGGQQHTATGAVIGTALYMSPEQIRGERLDERTDIYSLGVVLFEMVDGAPPFEADSAMSLLMMHLNDPVPDLRNYRQDVPDELVRIIEKALAKDRNRRYQKASEMAADLRRVLRVLEGQPGSDSVLMAGPRASVVQPVNQMPQVVPLSSAAASTNIPRPVTASQQAPQRVTSTVVPGGPYSTTAGSAGPVPAPAKSGVSPVLMGLGGALAALIILCILGSAVFLFNQVVGNQRRQARAAAAAQTSTAEALLAEALLPSATASPAPTFTPEPLAATPTLSPSSTPIVEAVEPTATVEVAPEILPTEIPPGVPYVMIVSIAIENGVYVVQYETMEFIESPTSTHIHFVFDTVSQEDAGIPGKGPWIMYTGPRPFTGYKVSDRPPGALQMCAYAANRNHTIIPDSGNCVDLPPNP